MRQVRDPGPARMRAPRARALVVVQVAAWALQAAQLAAAERVVLRSLLLGAAQRVQARPGR